MGVAIRVPLVGISVEKGMLACWLVAHGAVVQKGQAICSFEFEKTIVEIEAPQDGSLVIIGVPGQEYAVDALIAEIV